MGQRGPKPEPSAIKLARGTFRGRDAGRLDVTPVTGQPVRPDGLDDAGGTLWDQITAEHANRGTLGTIDTAALRSLCTLWSLACQTMPLAAADPTDKDARCSLIAYLTACDKLGSKFGWTTSDRANIKTTSTEAASALTKFAARRAT